MRKQPYYPLNRFPEAIRYSGLYRTPPDVLDRKIDEYNQMLDRKEKADRMKRDSSMKYYEADARKQYYDASLYEQKLDKEYLKRFKDLDDRIDTGVQTDPFISMIRRKEKATQTAQMYDNQRKNRELESMNKSFRRDQAQLIRNDSYSPKKRYRQQPTPPKPVSKHHKRFDQPDNTRRHHNHKRTYYEDSSSTFETETEALNEGLSNIYPSQSATNHSSEQQYRLLNELSEDEDASSSVQYTYTFTKPNELMRNTTSNNQSRRKKPASIYNTPTKNNESKRYNESPRKSPSIYNTPTKNNESKRYNESPRKSPSIYNTPTKNNQMNYNSSSSSSSSSLSPIKLVNIKPK